jgi:hypothetical protein
MEMRLMNRSKLKTFPGTGPRFAAGLVMAALLAAVMVASAQPEIAGKAAAGPVFRLDGGNTTYAFGVNERGELQQIYWGGRIGASDAIPTAHSDREWASFDSPYNNTPQEYSGWGAGLFQEPALKVAFADGNRDLVLHYVSGSKPDADSLEITLKDISRAVTVTLHYKMDSASGTLHAQLPDRSLGGRVDAEPGEHSRRRAGAGEPAWINRASGKSVVCHRQRRRR